MKKNTQRQAAHSGYREERNKAFHDARWSWSNWVSDALDSVLLETAYIKRLTTQRSTERMKMCLWVESASVCVRMCAYDRFFFFSFHPATVAVECGVYVFSIISMYTFVDAIFEARSVCLAYCSFLNNFHCSFQLIASATHTGRYIFFFSSSSSLFLFSSKFLCLSFSLSFFPLIHRNGNGFASSFLFFNFFFFSSSIFLLTFDSFFPFFVLSFALDPITSIQLLLLICVRKRMYLCVCIYLLRFPLFLFSFGCVYICSSFTSRFWKIRIEIPMIFLVSEIRSMYVIPCGMLITFHEIVFSRSVSSKLNCIGVDVTRSLRDLFRS